MSGSSTWMLSLLLVLCIYVHHIDAHPYYVREFMTDIDMLQSSVKDLTHNCIANDVSNDQCKCLNISLSQGECVFPHYFIKGLTSMLMNCSSPQRHFMERMLVHLETTFKNLTIDFCKLATELHPKNGLISPKRFYQGLGTMTEEINTLLLTKK